MAEIELRYVAVVEGAEILVREDLSLNGQQMLIRFPNGRGASVVLHDGSYGVELAVIVWDSLASDLETGWDIDYSPGAEEITGASGVLGWLTPEMLEDALRKIRELAPVFQELE